LHIVFVSQIVPYPPHGGVLQRGFNLLREISINHRVDLLAYVHPDSFHRKSDIEESRRILGQFCKRVEYISLWPKISPIHKYAAFMAATIYDKPFSVLAHRSKALLRMLQEIINYEKPDLVHLDTIALAPLKDVCRDVPVVMTHHNIESQLMDRRAAMENSPFVRWYVARQARLLHEYEIEQSPKVSLNIMVSELDAQTLQGMVPGVRTLVVENGVDTTYFRPIRGYEESSLIYTGGMNMFANRDAVMWFIKEIWPRLKAVVPDLRFIAVGQDPPPEIKKIADRNRDIEIPGFVDDIRPWVSRAAAYIVPLRVGGGTRLKVVDAMAQGKAIVSTTLGCEGIRVTDGENISIANTPEEITAKVLELLRNKELRTRLGDAARQLVESEYAWPRLGKELMRGYSSAVRKVTDRGNI